MSISRIKQIKRILQDDVRDPRATIKAIADVVTQPKQSKPEADTVLQLTLVRTNSAVLGCVIKTDPEQLQPKHVTVAIQSATVSSTELKDLFDKITKGNLQ